MVHCECALEAPGAALCRLFGFRSALPSRPHRSLLAAENAIAAQSKEHPHGWGIGWFADEEAYVVKSATPAHTCDRFEQISGRLLSQTFLVHVRRATVGRLDPLNAHPFRCGRWLFAHNGTLFGFDILREWMAERTDPELRALILGDTDSEALFFYLMTELSKAGVHRCGRLSAEPQQVAATVRRTLAALDTAAQELGLSRPIVNVMLTDGRLFLAHRAGMPLHLSTQKHACADAPTCPIHNKVCLLPKRPDQPVNHLLVASEPIGQENFWEPITDGATIVLDEEFRLHRWEPDASWVPPEIPLEYRKYIKTDEALVAK